jgi:hypothetical protein
MDTEQIASRQRITRDTATSYMSDVEARPLRQARHLLDRDEQIDERWPRSWASDPPPPTLRTPNVTGGSTPPWTKPRPWTRSRASTPTCGRGRVVPCASFIADLSSGYTDYRGLCGPVNPARNGG